MTESIDRRRFAFGALGVATALGAPTVADAGSLSPQRLSETIQRYASEGYHRTASDADRRTTDWIADRLRGSGFDVALDAFDVDTYPVAEARLSLDDGEEIACDVQWPSPPQNAVLSAPLVRIDNPAAAAGALVVVPGLNPPGAYWPAEADRILAGLAAAGAIALIVCVDTPTGQPFLYNRALDPVFHIPVITTGPGALASLLASAEQGRTATISLAIERSRGETRNILASCGPPGRGIVLSTPLTGWFQCGSERGPGVALALGLAEALGSAGVGVTVVGSAGHEIGHLGMHRVLHDDRLATITVPLWVHLGSSIAALARPGVPSVFATADVLPRVRTDMETLDLVCVEAHSATPGETGTIIASGRPSVLGFAGTGRAFHTAMDDGADVDAALLARIGERVLTLALGSYFNGSNP